MKGERICIFYQKVCKELGIEPIEPLWKRNSKEFMQDITETGTGFWI